MQLVVVKWQSVMLMGDEGIVTWLILRRTNPRLDLQSCRTANKVTSMQNDVRGLIRAVTEIQRIPYTWPAPPTALSVRQTGRGTCAGKHALLREQLELLGLPTRRLMVIGLLVPDLWPDLQAVSGGMLEVHECLTVETTWVGPLLVDVTWHPAALRAGLSGTLEWDGLSDMVCAVAPVASYAVSDDEFRAQKELLRARLYSPEQRAKRDHVLAEIADRASRFQ